MKYKTSDLDEVRISRLVRVDAIIMDAIDNLQHIIANTIVLLMLKLILPSKLDSDENLRFAARKLRIQFKRGNFSQKSAGQLKSLSFNHPHNYRAPVTIYLFGSARRTILTWK